VHACREHLLGYGGHFAAAGLSLLPENVAAFTNKFEEIVAASISAHLLIPEIIIDTEISFTDLTQNFYNLICQMEPFGPENMRPVFVAKNVLDTGYSKIVKNLHVRFVVKQDTFSFTGIGFNLAEKFDLLKNPVDIVFTLDENEWNGNVSLQLKVIDLRSSE
jgi:single-stranded-DNA-specific exonuclease